MLSKESFVKALALLKEQADIDEQFCKALDLVGNGHFAYGCDNKYREALLMVMKETVNDKYDYIEWWLYEAEPEFKVWTNDMKQEWVLKEPAALYDFIRNECQ